MLRRIGDVILTTPAARALRKLFPQARIDFLTEPPSDEALAGNPDLSRVLRYAPEPGEGAAASYLRWLRRIRAERYDWVVDYMGNPRSAILTFASGAGLRAGPAHVWHRWAYNRLLRQSPEACYAGLEKIRVLRSLGLEPDASDFLPRLHLTEEAKGAAARALAGLWPDGAGPLVGLVPASRKETRRWPAASYAALARLLAERADARALVFWGPGERELAEQVAQGAGPGARAAPRTASLTELAALLSRCQAVVTNCNGPKHLAVACGVPTVTIHGSSDPASWNPPDPRHLVVRLEELHCIGCALNECPYGLECMTGLSPELVAGRTLEVLGLSAARR
ncbi:MAG: glycosyltransferase family 9 protein [Elusimicrobia bacterium]|nr:glycosyltransferase family 9 protein [Elusimicrobiota bacterium]